MKSSARRALSREKEFSRERYFSVLPNSLASFTIRRGFVKVWNAFLAEVALTFFQISDEESAKRFL